MDDSNMEYMVLGASGCLLGEAVRYDGTGKEQSRLTRWRNAGLTVRTFCPEVGIGLGIPRPTIELVQVPGKTGIQVLGVEDKSLDVTDALTSFGQNTVINNRDLCGYVFKARSPSCGVGTTEVLDLEGNLLGYDSGIQAATIASQMPYLPIIDEEQLDVPESRASFLKRMFLLLQRRSAPDADASFKDLLVQLGELDLLELAGDEQDYQRLLDKTL